MVKVRMLSEEMVEGLVRAWFEWPFKPRLIDLALAVDSSSEGKEHAEGDVEGVAVEEKREDDAFPELDSGLIRIRHVVKDAIERMLARDLPSPVWKAAVDHQGQRGDRLRCHIAFRSAETGDSYEEVCPARQIYG